MNTRSLLLVFMVLGCAASGLGQKTVTNSDLERYRNERTRAEEQLRQELARKGTSYEEVMRRNKESQKETIELSAKLKAERLEQERIDAERDAAARAAYNYRVSGERFDDGQVYWDGAWFNTNVLGTRRARFGARPFARPQGYFAGGQFWPTGPATRPQPLFRIGRRH